MEGGGQGSLSVQAPNNRPGNDFMSTVLQELKIPTIRFLLLWLLFTVATAIIGDMLPEYLSYILLVGSVLSIVGSSLVIMTGYLLSSSHNKAFKLVYYLALCDLMFALMLATDAIMVAFSTSENCSDAYMQSMAGYSLEWKDNNDGYCYFIALFGQVAAMGSMGYSFFVMLDLLLIVFDPLIYSRSKHKYMPYFHFIVWTVAIGTCIIPLGVNQVGMTANQTCWLKGDHVWFFWAFWYAFVLFALVGVSLLAWKLNKQADTNDRISASFVKVVTQSCLVVLTYFLSWIWNVILDSIILSGHSAPLWLVSVQLFWLGGVGFSNALVWAPFIQRALLTTRVAKMLGSARIYISSNDKEKVSSEGCDIYVTTTKESLASPSNGNKCDVENSCLVTSIHTPIEE